MTMEANNHKGLCACGGFVEKSKPYIAMICLQFGYAGMNIITKVSLNRGMSHYVLVVYRHAFATVALAPFALLFERKVRPKITLPIFIQMFILGMLGPVIDQNFYYMGLKYTSPTFSCAMSNMLPAMTFIMAVICRMEKINMKRIPCQAKVVGTVVTVAGAMLMTLYKGEVINLFWTKYIHSAAGASDGTAAVADKDWVMGSILLILATLAWAAFFILQAIAMKRYSAHLSLTTIVCFLGTLQSIAVTLVMEHKPDAWVIGFDMNLLAAAYAGIVSSGIAYYVQGLVMQKTGPVFVTSFSPLMMIIVAIMGSFILAENIYFGGVIGSVLIVCGLYAVLWGKHKESKEKQIQVEDIESIPEVIKQQQQDDDDEKRNRKIMPTIIEDIEANIIINGEEDDHQKSAAAKKEEEEKKKIKYNNSTTTTLALKASMPQQLQMLAMEAPNYKGRPSSI